MEITVTGRHVQISDRFRRLLDDKLSKVEQLAPRTQRVDVVVGHERSSTAKRRESVEITCLAKGPVIRAEAHADDMYSALDLALEKLMERLRRANDKRKVARRRAAGEMPPPELLDGAAATPPAGAAGEQTPEPDAAGDSPISVREKVHVSAPMTLDQALYSMELVGHDFFLFHDADTGKPSVVYKRRGWSYGVLHLDVVDGATGPAEAPAGMPAEATA